MIVQFVQFESSLTEENVKAVARRREAEYAATPGLVQKYYLKLSKPNHYGGFMIWESAEALQAFRETKLAQTIPSAYGIIGAPDIDVHELMFPLRDVVDFNAISKAA